MNPEYHREGDPVLFPGQVLIGSRYFFYDKTIVNCFELTKTAKIAWVTPTYISFSVEKCYTDTQKF
jgi:hypothetical protein